MVLIAVIGCGIMGIKIAGELAYHGHSIKLYDTNVNNLDTAHSRIEEDKKWLHQEGLLPEKKFLGQIVCLSLLDDAVRDADYILEVVIDDLQIKQSLFEKISACCRPDAIICSNTLRVDVTAIAEHASNRERTLGLRFLYPVYYIPEVEITPSKYTSGETIEKVRSLCERMGKTLFFRSGDKPLVLSEEQQEDRKQARLEQLRSCEHVLSSIPMLSQPESLSISPRDNKPYAYTGGGGGGGGFGGHAVERDCAICMERPRDCLLCPCHHMVTCSQCSKCLLNRRDACPICRKPIAEVIKVFHS